MLQHDKGERTRAEAVVGAFAKDEQITNKDDFKDWAIFKFILGGKDTKREQEVLEKLTDKKAYVCLLVDASTPNNIEVGYNGQNEDENGELDQRSTPNRWLDIEGKWFELKKNHAPWMEFAKEHIGLYEDESSKSNPIIKEWIDNHNSDFNLQGKDRPITSDDDPWCGIFVYNMLRLAGIKVERGSSWEYPSKASFFKDNWKNSRVITKPQYGAIAKMKWSHVTFIYKFDDEFIWVLGGNQAENGAAIRDGVKVNIVKYRRNQVQELIMPLGY